MKVSLLLRGHNFLESDRYQFPMDARDNLASVIDKLIVPLRSKYPGAKVFLATYDSPGLADIVAALSPCELILQDVQNSSQIETFKQGLKYVYENDDCDALIATRFDLAFKKGIDEWGMNIDDQTIYMPWKEGLLGWRSHRSVGDAVHVIGRRAMPDFYNAMIMNQVSGRGSLHLLYYFLRTLNGKLSFIEDGYWNSNSLFGNPECDNPLYRIFNRPRIDAVVDYTFITLQEIKAE